MKITLKDGSVKEYDRQCMSVLDIAKDISEGLARVATVPARVNGEVVDLQYMLWMRIVN